MTAKKIDGKAISQQLLSNVACHAASFRLSYGHPPGLAVVLVGNNQASWIYVRKKIKACEENGLFSLFCHFPSDVSEDTLIAKIDDLNKNRNINGILIQMPLPKHIDKHKVLESIFPEKDVDGFHTLNMGALLVGRKPLFLPCTPCAVMKLLETYQIMLSGKEAVVVGRSNIVGKPMALLLLEAGATVTVCHRNTRNLVAHTRRADILIAAVGKTKMFNGNMIKPGCVVIDIGINRDAKDHLCGDVDYDSAVQVASAITPVPGGVGPMTIAMLLTNTVKAAERQSVDIA